MDTQSIACTHIGLESPPSTNSEKKVCLVIQGLIMGGAENFFITLANNFKNHGITPVIIVLSNDIPMLNSIDLGLNIYILNRRFRYDLSISYRIRKILQAEKPAGVFCVGAFTYFLCKLPFLLKPAFTFFLSLHTTVPVSRKEHLLDRLYLKMLGKKDETIFICNNQREYYRHHYHFNPSRATVIYNGINQAFATSVDAEQRADMRIQIREELGIPLSAFTIIKVANFRKEKGHIDAVDALGLLHDQYKCPAHLILVGIGFTDYMDYMREYIESKGLGTYIHMVGGQKDVRPFLASADLFTLTSYSVETFSIAALEAMSFGLPCSLTDVGGASEMIDPELNGQLSEPRNPASIAKSWHVAKLKNYNKARIKELVQKKFDASKMVEQYAHFIKSKLEHSRHPK